MLELFYITNNPDVAKTAQNAGIDRIFVDMEYIGKEKRQPNMDTVKNHHTIDDVKNVRNAIDKAKLLVRVNPIHDGSSTEINSVIDAGADIIMLPMWKSVDEVRKFLAFVDKRVKTLLLLETNEAIHCLDDVLKLDGIDEVHIGLNDLSLSQGKSFMFELFADGTVDNIVKILKKHNMKFGVGGVGKVNSNNLLPAENILCEHYRLGSSMVIVARAFCDWTKYSLDEFDSIISSGIKENREYEKSIENKTQEFFNNKHLETVDTIKHIKKR